MAFSRRRFLGALGSAAGALAVVPWIDWHSQPVEANSLSIGDFQKLVDAALDRGRTLGCSFTGILIERRLDACVSLRAIPDGSNGASMTKSTQVPDVLVRENFRVCVRVLHSHVSGYAEGSILDEGRISLLTELAVANARAAAPPARSTVPHRWIAPRLSDAPDLSRRHRLAFQQAVHEAVMRHGTARNVGPSVRIRGAQICYVSTRGNCTHSSRVWGT